MGGAGVWKVELDDGSLRVQHAAKGSLPEQVPIEEFLERCRPYFTGGGLVVEQPFQSRLAEGMIRVYLSHDGWWGSRTSTRPGCSLRTRRERRPRRCSSSRRRRGTRPLRRQME